MEYEPSLNARNTRGQTPLHVALDMKDAAAARLLLERGADANTADHAGSTPLSLALGTLVTSADVLVCGMILMQSIMQSTISMTSSCRC